MEAASPSHHIFVSCYMEHEEDGHAEHGPIPGGESTCPYAYFHTFVYQQTSATTCMSKRYKVASFVTPCQRLLLRVVSAIRLPVSTLAHDMYHVNYASVTEHGLAHGRAPDYTCNNEMPCFPRSLSPAPIVVFGLHSDITKSR